MTFFSSWIMRRLHGDGPDGRRCGDCVNYREFAPMDDEYWAYTEVDDDEGWCAATGCPKVRRVKFVVDRHWLACALFKSHYREDMELLEALGQMPIGFAPPSVLRPPSSRSGARR